ncbi:MAG: hypothetical protein DHS20C11_11060 [Lysobacteraceae bacterium]|nr:MAG: hypothetical protein DHS20C11_11060 [Xanthomonadaceae bacterium]
MTSETYSSKGYLAVLATLLIPPVGHVYAGKPLRGLIGFSLIWAFVAAAGWAGAGHVLWLFYLLYVVFIGGIIALAVDAYRVSSRHKGAVRKWYNHWYVYSPLAVLFYLVGGLVGENRAYLFGFEPFRIPSSTMTPTLQRGDLIAIDSRRYDGSYVPKRGAVVVFEYPEDRSQDYVKRVIALPGESFEIVGGDVYINGQMLNEPFLDRELVTQDYSLDFAEVVVPDDAIWVLGDYRDNSRDSRFWGPLKLDHLVGEVGLIWYAFDFDRIAQVRPHTFDF